MIARNAGSSLAAAMVLLVGLLVANASIAVAQSDSAPGFFQKTIAETQPKMVKVYGAGAGRVEGFATGILVSGDGMILTAQGVILDGRRVRVVLSDGSSHQAAILKRDRETQLALLKISLVLPVQAHLALVGGKQDHAIDGPQDEQLDKAVLILQGGIDMLLLQGLILGI